MGRIYGKSIKILQFCVFFIVLSISYQLLGRKWDEIDKINDKNREGLQTEDKIRDGNPRPPQESKNAVFSRVDTLTRKIQVTTKTTTTKISKEKLEKALKPKDIPASYSNKGSAAANSVCDAAWKTNWDLIARETKPLITLNPNRFIYPLLVNGPNNQLIGLRDTIYLAIRLNRTVILPRFYKHRTDTTVENRSSAFIPASQRIDVASLAKFIPVLPYYDVMEKCRGGFDDLYFTSHKAIHSALTHVVEDVGVPIRTKDTGEPAREYPANVDPSFNALHDMKSAKRYIRQLYGSAGRCALYAAPFRTVGVRESPGSLKRTRRNYFNQTGTLLPLKMIPDKIPDEEVYALIVHSTPKPKHISSIVSDFTKDLGLADMKYVSIHWRYDPDDWQKRCRKDKRANKNRKEFVNEMCEKVDNTQPGDVARAISRFVRELEAKARDNIDAVYFAAPLAMENFVHEVEIELNTVREDEEGAVETLLVFTQANLHDHLLKYKSCETLKENYEDVFSQLEMEICSRAKAFLRSPSSSWSKVIKERRVIRNIDKYDGDIFKLAWRMAEKRLNE